MEGVPPEVKEVYPFSMPLFACQTLSLTFERAVAIIVGENGSGKSTLLEAIAGIAGFNPEGGSSSHLFGGTARQVLAKAVKAAWLPKIRRGFFFRSESFFTFSSYIDEIAKEDPLVLQGYGGRSLHARSHGESFLTLFCGRFSSAKDSLFVLDEPDAALSSTNQVAFLKILTEIEGRNNQVIMATHSPILMAYPNAQLLQIDRTRITEVKLRETKPFALWREFVEEPERYVADFLR